MTIEIEGNNSSSANQSIPSQKPKGILKTGNTPKLNKKSVQFQKEVKAGIRFNDDTRIDASLEPQKQENSYSIKSKNWKTSISIVSSKIDSEADSEADLVSTVNTDKVTKSYSQRLADENPNYNGHVTLVNIIEHALINGLELGNPTEDTEDTDNTEHLNETNDMPDKLEENLESEQEVQSTELTLVENKESQLAQRKTIGSYITNFFIKLYNKDKILIKPSELKDKKNKIANFLQSYKDNQLKYLFGLSIICPLLLPVFIIKTTDKIITKVRHKPLKLPKLDVNTNNENINTFMKKLTKSINSQNIKDILLTTTEYILSTTEDDMLAKHETYAKESFYLKAPPPRIRLDNDMRRFFNRFDLTQRRIEELKITKARGEKVPEWLEILQDTSTRPKSTRRSRDKGDDVFDIAESFSKYLGCLSMDHLKDAKEAISVFKEALTQYKDDSNISDLTILEEQMGIINFIAEAIDNIFEVHPALIDRRDNPPVEGNKISEILIKERERLNERSSEDNSTEVSQRVRADATDKIIESYLDNDSNKTDPTADGSDDASLQVASDNSKK